MFVLYPLKTSTSAVSELKCSFFWEGAVPLKTKSCFKSFIGRCVTQHGSHIMSGSLVCSQDTMCNIWNLPSECLRSLSRAGGGSSSEPLVWIDVVWLVSVSTSAGRDKRGWFCRRRLNGSYWFRRKKCELCLVFSFVVTCFILRVVVFITPFSCSLLRVHPPVCVTSWKQQIRVRVCVWLTSEM